MKKFFLLLLILSLNSSVQSMDEDAKSALKEFLSTLTAVKIIHNVEKTMIISILALAHQCDKERDYKLKIEFAEKLSLEEKHQIYYECLTELSEILSKIKNEKSGEILFKALIATSMFIQDKEGESCVLM